MITDLKQKIEKMEENSKMPEEQANKISQALTKLEESGEVDGLKEGTKAPDFTLPNALEEEVILSERLKQGPVVLVFYRGTWCPYCNRQLSAYQKLKPDIRDYDAEMIAISPQAPTDFLSYKEKEDLSFQLLSDLKAEVAAEYKILFEVPDIIREIYQGMDLDIAEFNAMDEWILPVPSVFIIDQDRIIRFADVNPDYTKRTEPQEIIDALKKL